MRTLLVLAALVAVAAPASGQDADPDSAYGVPLPEVLPDSLRPAPGPEPRTRPSSAPAGTTILASTASASAVETPPTASEPVPASALSPGTSGHAVEIVVANGSQLASLSGIRVVPTAAPAWVTLLDSPIPVGDMKSSSETPVRFAFSVAREAPVGAEGTLAFDVVDSGGTVLATRRFAIVVAPPVELALDLPRPNPSRGAIAVPFALPEPARVTVDVVDVLGRRVAVLVDGERPAGLGTATLAAGSLAPGTYIVRLAVEVAGQQEQRVRRLTVIR